MQTKLILMFRPASPRHKLRWSEEEKAYLLKSAKRGDSLQRMTQLLGRGEGAVLGMLVKIYAVQYTPAPPRWHWCYPKTGKRDEVVRTPYWAERMELTPEEARSLHAICRSLSAP